GGALITIMFQDRPDKVFVTWVYPEGAGRKLTLRKFDAGEFSDEDIRRINVRYKKLLNDKVHAMELQNPWLHPGDFLEHFRQCQPDALRGAHREGAYAQGFQHLHHVGAAAVEPSRFH